MKKHNRNHSESDEPTDNHNDAGDNEPTHAQISALAYHIYEDEGCIPGSDEANWREAERALRQQIEDGTPLFSNHGAGRDGAGRDGSRPRLAMTTR